MESIELTVRWCKGDKGEDAISVTDSKGRSEWISLRELDDSLGSVLEVGPNGPGFWCLETLIGECDGPGRCFVDFMRDEVVFYTGAEGGTPFPRAKECLTITISKGV